MEIELVTGIAAMERLRDEWLDLHAASAERTLYNHPDFCLSWLRHFGHHVASAPRSEEAHDGRHAHPFLMLARREGRLDAVWPLRLVQLRRPGPDAGLVTRLKRRLPIWTLDGLINSHTDHAKLLLRAGSEQIGGALVAHVCAKARWHRLNFGAHESATATGRALQAPPHTRETRRHHRHSRILRPTGHYSDYLAANPRLRKKIGRATRRLERDFGPLTLDWYSGDPAIERGFDIFVEVDAESWKHDADEGEALRDSPLPRAYYGELVRRFAALGRAHMCVMRLDGQPAAADLNFECDGVLYIYKTSYKEAFATKGHHRPGFVLQAMVTERGWQAFDAIDLMSDRFQREWQCDTYELVSQTRTATRPWRWLRSALPPRLPIDAG
ncbi:hypothetical protein C2I36_04385 [Rhodobacteraceae bacterium WD3A24]|nr:hypothetical protein C2I36_04385 [Rhodobacteraceae bacterium WD3A24]